MSIKLWDMDTMEHLSTISEGIVSPVVNMDLSVDDTFLVIGKEIPPRFMKTTCYKNSLSNKVS